MEKTKRKIQNDVGSVEVDLFGGAITNFHFFDSDINPLNFCFSADQMPANNKGGANYQGHFICLGRWGEPTSGEKAAGIPDHGQAGNIMWHLHAANKDEIEMSVTSPLEGLHLERKMVIHDAAAIYAVNETVTNINPLGRLYTIVQHPTLAAPFLNNDVIINCNAAHGFNYLSFSNPEQTASSWPFGILNDKSIINLSLCSEGSTSVFSFVINQSERIGWITAYSPRQGLLFGYLWKRSAYPWINLWQDWHEGQIRYRGLEFGTSGIHQPFRQILEDGNIRVFGEKTIEFIDAGEHSSRSYLSFLHKVADFKGIKSMSLIDEEIAINCLDTSNQLVDLAKQLTEFNRKQKIV